MLNIATISRGSINARVETFHYVDGVITAGWGGGAVIMCPAAIKFLKLSTIKTEVKG